MLKAALIGNSERIAAVYGGGRRERLATEFDLFPDIITPDSLRERQGDLKDVRFLFSTWGMPALDREQIALLPSLEAVFYGAGTVQGFARPFLKSGIKVVSAWGANAVPVAEYTVAQILLANKGFFRAVGSVNSVETWRKHDGSVLPGNYDSTVALLGAGMIGRTVIELLKPYALDVIVFDPFLSDADAATLGVEKVELADAFKRGLVVSNHLANLPATEGMLRREHFASMQRYGTFINTGRGATLDEPALIDVLSDRSDLTAVLDVTRPEPPVDGSPLYRLDNVILTPHIAGAVGKHEVWRMADYMIDEAIALRDGCDLKYEVTLKMLETMA
jgi:phosphoglycerate dehydrogenase-like enzyme